MRCPFCGELDTKVIDSRLSHDGYSIKRRRSCPSCNSRYNTQQTTDLSYPRVIKNDKSTEVFSEQKITKSIYIALEKRQVSADEIEKITTIIDESLSTVEKKLGVS